MCFFLRQSMSHSSSLTQGGDKRNIIRLIIRRHKLNYSCTAKVNHDMFPLRKDKPSLKPPAGNNIFVVVVLLSLLLQCYIISSIIMSSRSQAGIHFFSGQMYRRFNLRLTLLTPRGKCRINGVHGAMPQPQPTVPKSHDAKNVLRL